MASAVVARERQRAGRHLVEHDAEREQVGARVELPAARLLGRHVRHRAQRRPRHRHSLAMRGLVRRRRLGPLDQLRQAEVEHLGLAARRHEDVRRLDVAVDDALGVRGVERVGDLHGERQQRRRSAAVCRRCGA